MFICNLYYFEWLLVISTVHRYTSLIKIGIVRNSYTLPPCIISHVYFWVRFILLIPNAEFTKWV